MINVNSVAQVDSTKFPPGNIEFKLYTYFSDGSSVKTYTYGPSMDDSISLRNYIKKQEKDQDSIFLSMALPQLSKNKQSVIPFKEAIGVQVLAKLIGKTTKQYKAEITINDNIKEIIDVDFSKRDTVRKDMTPICFKKLKNLYSLDVTIFNEAERVDSFNGHSTNGHFNQLYLWTIFPGSEFNNSRLLHLFDTIKIHDWRGKYKESELDTGITKRYLRFDSIQKKYFVKRQYITYPEILVTKTNEEYVFWFSDIPKYIHLEHKIVSRELYDDDGILWIENDDGNSQIKVSISKPGIYWLRVRNPDYPKKIFTYEINVKPQWFQTLAFKIAGAAIITLIMLSFLFILYRRKQKRKMALIEKQKAQLDISLNSMRSQLNPHFIFNALNSIQGLITSTQYNKASEYLVDFSRLLRKPLNPNDIKHWTLSDEMELLNTYIKLEHLRAPFSFEMIVNDSILPNQINFPALLLQPLVENAIKHALPKATEPKLTVRFEKQNHDLLISIIDNGGGFDINEQQNGKGLKLADEYIELINKQFPESNTSINFDSNKNGTTVIITFQNWLDE